MFPIKLDPHPGRELPRPDTTVLESFPSIPSDIVNGVPNPETISLQQYSTEGFYNAIALIIENVYKQVFVVDIKHMLYANNRLNGGLREWLKIYCGKISGNFVPS